MAFVAFINDYLKTFPDISIVVYLMEVFHAVGIIFCVLEHGDIRDFVKIPYSSVKETITDKVLTTLFYNMFCWSIKIKWLHQYVYMFFTN